MGYSPREQILGLLYGAKDGALRLTLQNNAEPRFEVNARENLAAALYGIAQALTFLVGGAPIGHASFGDALEEYEEEHSATCEECQRGVLLISPDNDHYFCGWCGHSGTVERKEP